ncbi:tripeptidyl-peptidase 1 precursor [Diaporthe helianthi]|uniref:tripeptidyl-peptidase II n=1 Tax=Diaporthe helianthi TaxID=158607 RepID=A0A2P5HJW8_DIAHE|nr:tripeptidyl-peptidase 1 precursor [Diaporthe helianthi]
MAGKFVSQCMTIFLNSLSSFLSSNPETTKGSNYPTEGHFSAIPAGWTELQSHHPDISFPFRISLAAADEALLENTLLRVSDPASEWYGHHLGREEARMLVQPSSKSKHAVFKWIESHGIEYELVDHFVHINTSLANANVLLGADFRIYRSEENGESYLSTASLTLPHDITQHVNLVYPSTGFYTLGTAHNANSYVDLTSGTTIRGRGHMSSLNHSSCNDVVDPSCIRQLYSIGVQSEFNLTANSSFGIATFLGAKVNATDLEEFVAEHSPGRNISFPSTISLTQSNVEEASNSAEADLDLQLAVSLAEPVPVTLYSYPGRAPWFPDSEQPDRPRNEPYLEFLEALLALPNAELPTVLSVSFAETEQSVPIPYARMVCKMMAQLGVRGVSILVASGDSGVGKSCQANANQPQGKARGEGARFLPNFPASCPWVTAVGGTERLEPSERAVPFSSGGFSDVFPRPQYQDIAVAGYLEATVGERWAGLYNPDGRGIPDVAALANNILIRHDGQDKRVGGTSAASPIFAAVVSLLNAVRLGDGLPPLGFLNPWLYQFGPEMLTDVTEGSSWGCKGSAVSEDAHSHLVPGAGWEAAKGWDPVTGLGTPNLPKMMKGLYNSSMWFCE